jgi:hypothetical protein
VLLLVANVKVPVDGALATENDVTWLKEVRCQALRGVFSDELQLLRFQPPQANVADVDDWRPILHVVGGFELRSERTCLDIGYARVDKAAD